MPPRALIRNNSTNGSNVSVTMLIGSYNDTRNIYLGPGQTGELPFNNFILPQVGFCTTRCYINTADQRQFNNSLSGEILVIAPGALVDNNTNCLRSTKFSVYPNPARSYFSVRLSLSTDRLEIKIFDITGKLIKSEELKGKNYRISLDGIKNGVYFVKVDNNTQVTKIIVTK
jgi:hypothetical protein